MEISRRNVLKVFGATAVGTIAAGTVGIGEASAASPKIGEAYIARLWGTKASRRKIVGSSPARYETVRVPVIKNVYRGTSNSSLNRGLGLWPDSAVAGTDGHTVIFGHRTSHGGPMRNAHKLKGEVDDMRTATKQPWYDGPADVILLNGFQYVVERVHVLSARPRNAADNAVILSYPSDLPGASGGRLSLIACTNPKGLPTGTRHRIVVRARLVGPVPA